MVVFRVFLAVGQLVAAAKHEGFKSCMIAEEKVYRFKSEDSPSKNEEACRNFCLRYGKKRCAAIDFNEGVCRYSMTANPGNKPFLCKIDSVLQVGQEHKNSEGTELEIYGPIRPNRSLTLPANTGKSFAVVLSYMLAQESPEVFKQIYIAGGRMAVLCHWDFQKDCERHVYTALGEWPSRERVGYIHTPITGMWIRDHAPFYLLEQVERWERMWLADFRDPEQVGDLFLTLTWGDWGSVKDAIMVTLRDLHLEGGNVISNGMGKCIIGKSVLCKNAKWLCALTDSSDGDYMGSEKFGSRNPIDYANNGTIFHEIASRPANETFPLKKLVAKWIEDFLEEHFGCDILFMEGVPGDMLDHVDMFYFWLDPSTVMMGVYNTSTFRIGNATEYFNRKERNRNVLEQAGLVVKEVPMPPIRRIGNDTVFYTHLNGIVITNVAQPAEDTPRTLLMPTYDMSLLSPDEQKAAAYYSQEAVNVYKEYNFTVVPVDVTYLQDLGGAIHCVTNMVPYIEGNCASSSTNLYDYFKCLDDQIPSKKKESLRDGEIHALTRMQNIVTQEKRDCSNGKCEPAATNRVKGFLAP